MPYEGAGLHLISFSHYDFECIEKNYANQVCWLDVITSVSLFYLSFSYSPNTYNVLNYFGDIRNTHCMYQLSRYMTAKISFDDRGNKKWSLKSTHVEDIACTQRRQTEINGSGRRYSSNGLSNHSNMIFF